MKTKYFLIFPVLVLSLFLSKESCAQGCVRFKYDADGNREKRIVMNNCHEVREVLDVQETVDNEEFRAYPNPTNGNFKIETPDLNNGYKCYELYDINGVMVREHRLSGKDTDVDIGDLPAGIYLLKIIAGDEVFSKIILKQ